MSHMRMLAYLVALLGARLALSAPTQFPISDGFPNPSPDQLETIERGAHGTLPDTGPPTLHPDTYKSLQLIATNEMIEVSLYETCLLKIKAGGPGFGPENFVSTDHYNLVVATFELYYQQEEIHALIGQGGLKANGQPLIEPSEYTFNTNTYQDCLREANELGDNVLAVSQGVINQAIAAGDIGLPAQLDALIAQEGQQSGFLRSEMLVDGHKSRMPGAMSGYTSSARQWLWSLLQQHFIKPGSDQNKVDIPVKFPMTVVNENIQPVDQTLQFTVNPKAKTGNSYIFPLIGKRRHDPKDLYVTYVSGLNMPFSVPVQNFKFNGTDLVFSASFPAYTKIINGFAIAALTDGNNFTTTQAAADNSIAGPATIELVN